MRPLPDAQLGRGREFMKRFVAEKRAHISYPLYFLQQAAAALDGGSALGTSLLCRAALEAAYCFFLQWAGNAVSGHEHVMASAPQLLPGQKKPGDRAVFGNVMRRIEESKLLSPAQLKASERIRHNGNWVAHILQVTEKERLRSPNPLDWTPWIDENGAWADFEDAADIIRTIEGAFPSIYR